VQFSNGLAINIISVQMLQFEKKKNGSKKQTISSNKIYVSCYLKKKKKIKNKNIKNILKKKKNLKNKKKKILHL